MIASDNDLVIDWDSAKPLIEVLDLLHAASGRDISCNNENVGIIRQHNLVVLAVGITNADYFHFPSLLFRSIFQGLRLHFVSFFSIDLLYLFWSFSLLLLF